MTGQGTTRGVRCGYRKHKEEKRKVEHEKGDEGRWEARRQVVREG